jgi:sugar transferase
VRSTTHIEERLAAHIDERALTPAQGLAAAASGSAPWIGSFCQLLFVQNPHDIQSLWLRTRMLGGAIGIEVRRDHFRRYNRLSKRVLDLALAVPLALLSAPLVAVLALVIKVVDRGPSFYVQERVGHNGATLPVIKLRTMRVDADCR